MLRVALVHDWLLTHRGGEKVLEAIAELFPQAPIFTLFHDSTDMPEAIERHAIITSWIDRIPGARVRHRLFLPLMPAAIRTLTLPPVDLVISSSHCVAKAVRIPKGAKHLSYVHAPLRYMWDRFDDYFGRGRAPLPIRAAARVVRPAFRAWDVSTNAGVDRFVANSQHVAAHIADRYRREAGVIHPPVELDRFIRAPLEGLGQGGYFLCLGALAPYKRLDVAIEAFASLGLPLWIVGSGQSQRWLQGLPSNVRALGQVADEDIPELYRNARALVFPGVEDFGLTPLEAQACGRPVLAFAQGGALETVTPHTGVFFNEQTPQSLAGAVRALAALEETFSPARARLHAQAFTKAAFQEQFLREVEALVPRSSAEIRRSLLRA